MKIKDVVTLPIIEEIEGIIAKEIFKATNVLPTSTVWIIAKDVATAIYGIMKGKVKQ